MRWPNQETYIACTIERGYIEVCHNGRTQYPIRYGHGLTSYSPTVAYERGVPKYLNKLVYEAYTYHIHGKGKLKDSMYK